MYLKPVSKAGLETGKSMSGRPKKASVVAEVKALLSCFAEVTMAMCAVSAIGTDKETVERLVTKQDGSNEGPGPA